MTRIGLVVGVGTAIVSIACGGGGGGGGSSNSNPVGPPPCQDQGITATAIFRPGNSSCNVDNTLSARVSNRSCEPLTINAVSTQGIDPGGGCGDLSAVEDFQINPITIESKEAETVDLLNITWCCTCTISFECTWVRELTLHTDQGDIEAEPSKPFTKSFGPFCEDCSASSSRLAAPFGLAPECSVGTAAREPLYR